MYTRTQRSRTLRGPRGRMTLVTATVVAASLALTGCSGSSDDDPTDVTAVPASEQADGQFPVSIPTKFGDVTIDEQPERVVTLGWGDTDTALALGVQPVGNLDWLEVGGTGVGDWASDSYTDDHEVMPCGDLDYEAIAAMKPDLITYVKTDGDEEAYKRLSDIAPTVGIPEGGEGSRTPMNQQVEMIAAALGKPEEGRKLVDQVEDRYSELREKHPEWQGKTLSSVYHEGSNYAAYLPGDARADIPAALGFEMDPRVTDISAGVNKFTVNISTEQLNRVDSDVVIGIPVRSTKEELENDRAWKNLSAVKENRAFVLDTVQTDAFSMGSVSSILFVLDALEPSLAAATDSRK